MYYIKYRINKEDKSYSIETQGLEGSACEGVINKLVQKIGGSIDDERYNDDWYKAPKAGVTSSVSE